MNAKQFQKYHGANVESDWQRLRALNHVCGQVGGISTPAALKIDVGSQVILYEHATFPAPLIASVGDDRVFEALGHLLAQMHQAEFNVERGFFSSDPYPLGTFDLSGSELKILHEHVPVGWFHGDFCHGNVFCGADGNVVVVDPLPARHLFVERYVRASGALDLATMYMGILLCHPLRRQILLDVPLYLHACEVFLNAYLTQIDAQTEDVLQAVRRLSGKVGLSFIDGYTRRLSQPLAQTKRQVALKVFRRVDERTGWGGA